ncbi:CpsD/CapB family tyrosine-protein kinase [Chondromyces crocatus]|uniref:CobQ/CobB/MinD/ParA nucleotide binding domain-containing protein n=1 Tax=Chondromyces crocatus TaxID=52 RepID=A0A0K1EA95_CHOCO|nr:CpsD/CapB family tyrosine-protein kinase [Chondromyces crocatus]AKT37774.1 uncharacterized protein CMC5_019160 [Chondromyces crocatus]
MAEPIEAGKPAPVASLERALDQVIDFLGRVEHAPRARALAIEARRLRTIVGKWRSIEPPEDVREEMIARVLRLANDAEEAIAEAHAGAGRQPSSPQLTAGRSIDADAARAAQRRGSAPVLDLGMWGPGQQESKPDARTVEVNRFTPPSVPRYEGRAQGMPAIPDLSPGAQPPRPATPSRGMPSSEQPFVMPSGGPRVPSLQFERVAQPSPEPEVLEGELIDPPQPPRMPRPEPRTTYEADASTMEIAGSPVLQAQREVAQQSPPSLRLDHDASPPSYDEMATTLFAVPSGIKNLSALSVIPAQRPEGLDPNLVMISEPYGKRADSFRALRRKLAAGSARIIAITSAKPQEGKTVCAINLALALAESSPRNVLLVEANIRNPGLAATMKFEPQLCFTEQLRRHRKDEDEPWVVVEQTTTKPTDEAPGSGTTRGGVVHMLAVDPRAERPPMLDAVAFAKGMEGLKRTGYEYIIVDTPAVLGTLDMQIIGDVVHGVIFTTIVKRSTRRPLRDAIAQIKPAPVLGVIVLEG